GRRRLCHQALGRAGAAGPEAGAPPPGGPDRPRLTAHRRRRARRAGARRTARRHRARPHATRVLAALGSGRAARPRLRQAGVAGAHLGLRGIRRKRGRASRERPARQARGPWAAADLDRPRHRLHLQGLTAGSGESAKANATTNAVSVRRKASAAPVTPIVGTSTRLATTLATRPAPVATTTIRRRHSSAIGVTTASAAPGSVAAMRRTTALLAVP